jgi:hypothetical protein
VANGKVFEGGEKVRMLLEITGEWSGDLVLR